MTNPIWFTQSAIIGIIAITALIISIISYSENRNNVVTQTSSLVQLGSTVNDANSDIGFTSNYYNDQGVVYTTGFYRSYSDNRYILFDEPQTDDNQLRVANKEIITSTLAGINVKNIQVNYGSLTEPSIWFGSKSTGIYAPDENSINMVINGSNSVTIQDGKLGVNNTSPSYALDVDGTCRFTGAVTFGSTLNFSTTLSLSSLVIGGTTVIDSSLNMSNINNATIDNYLSLSYENVSGTTIDTDITTSLIGISNSNSEFTLANGTAGVVKVLQSKKSTNVYVALEQATLLLNPVNPISNLVYTDTWNILQGQPIIKYQQGSKIVGTGYTGSPNMGWYADISADGNTIAFGGPINNSNIGAVWVWTRSGSTWSEEKAAIVGTGYTGSPQMGRSVALSADGNTLAFGGYASIGAVWIWTRSGTTWSEEKAAIVGTGYTGTPYMGYSVALSADGNTLAFGGFLNNSSIGAIWIWTRSGTTWSEEKAAIVGTGYTGFPRMGISVCLSADGNTLAFGGHTNNSNVGAVWVWSRSGTTWTEQKAAMVGSGYTGTPYMGYSVSLSADGDTLAFGGYRNDSNVGAVWIWTRSVTTWTEQRAALLGTGYTGTPYFGSSVSLSDDGNMLAVGGYADDSNIGATWVFKRTNAIWSEQSAALIGTGYTGASQQGTVVALSSQGTTLMVSAPADNSTRGAVWIFK